MKISHEDAVIKAEVEFERFHQAQSALPLPVDQHFEQSLDELKKIEKRKPQLPAKPAKKKPKPPCTEGES
ncbi:MAG: hypothetical protein FD138_1125 [Planctomycetota bacterium]|nr:MAG: hypothetical protein FD138_1125 [Planctomycetota bacterium]